MLKTFDQWRREGPGEYVEAGVIALNIASLESVKPIRFNDGSFVFKIKTMSSAELYVTPLATQEDLPEIFKFFD